MCLTVFPPAPPKGKAPDGLKATNDLSNPLISLPDSISIWSNQEAETVQLSDQSPARTDARSHKSPR